MRTFHGLVFGPPPLAVINQATIQCRRIRKLRRKEERDAIVGRLGGKRGELLGYWAGIGAFEWGAARVWRRGALWSVEGGRQQCRVLWLCLCLCAGLHAKVTAAMRPALIQRRRRALPVLAAARGGGMWPWQCG